MNLTKAELKKIMYEYNALASRLLKCDFHDYNDVLRKFQNFTSSNLVIKDYIENCGKCTQDMNDEFKQVGRGNATFELGDTVEEETRNINAILNHIVCNGIDVPNTIGFSYCASQKTRDVLNAFNDRVTMVLISHIETYLTKLGIDMGVDESVLFSISGNGQVNIAQDNATINATAVFGEKEIDEIKELINGLKTAADAADLSSEEKEIIDVNTEHILEEIKAPNPRKAFLRAACNSIKMIKASGEFAAAAITIWQFIESIL